MNSRFIFLLFSVALVLFFHLPDTLSQNKNLAGINTIVKDGEVAFETSSKVNNGKLESLDDHLFGFNNTSGERFVLGGEILWFTQDAAAIANVVALNNSGNSAFTGWGLNDMRATMYSDVNSNPLWDFPTGQFDPFVDISGDGSIAAVTAGINFYLLNPVDGNIVYQFALPDSFYASSVAITRDGSLAVMLAQTFGSSTTARAYGLNLSGTPSIAWTFDVPVSAIANWAGVNFSADGLKVAITGRNHLYILNSVDGTLIWDHFVDNTESAPSISGDGKIVVTADNNGFVQTWIYDSQNSEYSLLWQYKIPAGSSTNWASSVGVSADGNTIVAGSLLFLPSGNDGSIMCFDTYAGGNPKWIYSGVGDLVGDIKLSDDGKVAVAATWGDLAHTKPDMLVFDTQTGDLTFSVVTPGSFFTCDITPDGKRVFGGGKAVHAREFGNGGRIYLCNIDLGGGSISGVANLTDVGDDSGILVTALGTTRSAVTNSSGNYIIENIPAGTYTINAEKPGYNFGSVSNVAVTDTALTSGINFSMTPFTILPPTLSASTGQIGAITLSWSGLFNKQDKQKGIAEIVGDYYSSNKNTDTKSITDTKISIPEESQALNAQLLADSIFIYRSLAAGGPYSKIGSVSTGQSSYVDYNVLPLSDYYYVVNIVTGIGQSIYSNEAMGNVSDTLFNFNIQVPQSSIPTIDGILSAGEWDDAIKIDVSDIFGYGSGYPKPDSSAYLYFKFDDANNTLYVAGEDFLNTALNDNEGFGFYFDDNNNNVYNSQLPFIQEGNYWAYWHPSGSDLRFRDLTTFVIDTLQNAEIDFSDASGHLQGEVAIPMGFEDGNQLQVFGPDRIVGLGAFIIERQSGAAVFNGWWPQTMNSLFSPVYFGNVGIDATLDAPPQPPSNVSVTRQGEDLLITWDDPTLGINNELLPVAPIINIYKNGEFLTSFQTGVETYLDADVYCVAWYEYQFEAYIINGSDTLTGPMAAPVGAYSCEDPNLVPISYDDGNWNGFYVASFSWEENKFAVRYTPASYPVYIRKLETLVNGNDAFDFTIQKDDGGIPGDVMVGPYRVYDSSPATVATIIKNIPGIDPPEITQGDFWVVINWLQQSPGAPGIGADTDPPIDNRSMYYLTSSGWVAIAGVDIMVTAYVSDQPVGVEISNGGSLPIIFNLEQNYPNPFNPNTIISYQIPQNELVTLEIYSALGEKIRTLINEFQDSGRYEVTWDGKNSSGVQLSSGMYLYRLQAGSNIKTMKMILLK